MHESNANPRGRLMDVMQGCRPVWSDHASELQTVFHSVNISNVQHFAIPPTFVELSSVKIRILRRLKWGLMYNVILVRWTNQRSASVVNTM